MAVSRSVGTATPARIRIPSYAVWEVAVFVLNVLAFILVGFQLRLIVSHMQRAEWIEYGIVGGCVTLATILARIAWVKGAAYVSSLWCRERPHEGVALSGRAATVVGWCGMRGTVTLAAALALPTGHDGIGAFPYRDLILFTAFAVVLGTLVVQGMTLRPLLSRLGLEDDGEVEHEVRLARVETLRAAIAASENCEGADTAELVRRRYALLLHRAETELTNGKPVADGDGDDESTQIWRALSNDAAVIRVATAAERKRLIALRDNGTIGDAAYQQIEQELDWEELDLQQLARM
jgi:CPA1 family monovalent cation:H+ antiporter